MYLHPRLPALTEGVRLRIVAAALIGLLAVAAGVARLAVVATVIVKVIHEGAAFSTLTWALVAIAALIIARSGLQYLQEVISHHTASMVKVQLRKTLYEHSLALGPGYFDQARTGDVIHFDVTLRDASGNAVADIPIQYAFQGRNTEYSIGDPGSGLITDDGRFVADLAGEYTIVAAAGNHTASITVAIEARDVKREIEVVGQGRVSDRGTSDLWVWEGPDGRDYAATGTWGADGHAYFWDVTDPGNMQIIDTIRVDARTVNDIKVSEDGRIAVISREGASNRRNGLVILDVSDLYDQGARVLARYDDQLTGGVHNIFIYEDHIYALSAGRRYDVINIEDPTNPHRVGTFELDTPGHSIHDVWITDGIAYSSNWADGLDVPLLSDKPDAEYLFWVGCAPSFDDRAKKTAQATAKLLKLAGVDFAILGPEEQCTGDPARRAGNEFLFQTFAKANCETLNNHKVKKIVTTCPHCYNTLGNEYPDFGGNGTKRKFDALSAEIDPPPERGSRRK